MKGESNRSAQLQNVITMMTATFVANVFGTLKIALLEEKRSRCRFIASLLRIDRAMRSGSFKMRTQLLKI